LEPLLEHLLFVNELPFSVEVIICDNASTDATEEVVKRYQDRLPLRYYRQPVNLGFDRNINTSFRCATGRYTVYLADDDRLIPDVVARHVALLNERPDLVMLHAPWLIWDEENDCARATFYSVDRLTVFDPDNALPCMEFILSRTVFPEHAIYRTDVLLKLIHLPHNHYVYFLMVFRAFQYGSVGFHPESYYRNIARADGGVADGSLGQVGHVQAISLLDEYRGGLEVSLLHALRGLAPLPIPRDVTSKALMMINRFLVGRLEVAARLSRARRDFIGAAEFKQREWLWRDDLTSNEVIEWERKHLLLVAAQAVVELQRAHTHFGPLVLCGLPEAEAEACCWLIEQVSSDIEVSVLSFDEALAQVDFAQHLYLVDSESVREQLLGSDLAVGQVLSLDDVKAQFRVLPRSFRS